jgi:antitoxin component YwqK of YwqJK toxin-antitoxin module
MKFFFEILCFVIVLGLVSCRTYKEKSYWENGKLKSVITRSKTDSLYAGRYIEYYENGKRKKVRFYKKDLPVRCIKEWYEEGQVKTFKKIYNSKRDTLLSTIDEYIIQTYVYVIDYSEVKYLKDGTIDRKGNYKQNKKEGRWLIRDSVDNKLKEFLYSNDSAHARL